MGRWGQGLTSSSSHGHIAGRWGQGLTSSSSHGHMAGRWGQGLTSSSSHGHMAGRWGQGLTSSSSHGHMVGELCWSRVPETPQCLLQLIGPPATNPRTVIYTYTKPQVIHKHYVSIAHGHTTPWIHTCTMQQCL